MGKQLYKNSKTKSIQPLIDRYIFEYTEIVLEISKIDSPIKGCKALLGQQNECWVGGSENRRLYIWKKEELWILAHNTAGIWFEVDANVTIDRARELWAEFKKSIVSHTKYFMEVA
jgi:hypothetical protein